MSDQERYEKYIKEHCKNCKNKDTDLCEIRIISACDVVKTKCVYYEKEEGKIKKYVKPIERTAKFNKTIMGLSNPSWS